MQRKEGLAHRVVLQLSFPPPPVKNKLFVEGRGCTYMECAPHSLKNLAGGKKNDGWWIYDRGIPFFGENGFLNDGAP